MWIIPKNKTVKPDIKIHYIQNVSVLKSWVSTRLSWIKFVERSNILWITKDSESQILTGRLQRKLFSMWHNLYKYWLGTFVWLYFFQWVKNKLSFLHIVNYVSFFFSFSLCNQEWNTLFNGGSLWPSHPPTFQDYRCAPSHQAWKCYFLLHSSLEV